MTNLTYKISYAAGFLLTLPLQAFYGIVAITKRIGAVATGNPYTKFYYLDPAMHLYISAAQMLFNQIAVGMGIVGQAKLDSAGEVEALSQDDIKAMHRLLPDILKVNSDGSAINGIDLFSVVNRAQRLANQHYDRLSSFVEDASIRTPEDYVNAVRQYMSGAEGLLEDTEDISFAPYFNGAFDRRNAQANSLSGSHESLKVETPPEDETAGIGEMLEDAANFIKTKMSNLADNYRANLNDGSAFVSFAIEPPEPSESFSTSTKESPLAEKYNSIQKSQSDARFSLADGNVFGGAQKFITDSISSIGAGLADSVGLGVFDNVGKALADLPLMVDESTAELSSTSFTLKLRSPYGDKLSILMNIYLPLCMLMAGTWPLSTGKHSYTKPFLCRAFCQGVIDSKLTVISGLRIKRATSNIKWTRDGLPTGIDVDVDLTSLDKVIHMPLVTDPSIFKFFDEDSALTDYLGTLSGMSLFDTYYFQPRFNMMWAKTVAEFKSMKTAGAMASWASSGTSGRLISAITRSGVLR